MTITQLFYKLVDMAYVLHITLLKTQSNHHHFFNIRILEDNLQPFQKCVSKKR